MSMSSFYYRTRNMTKRERLYHRRKFWRRWVDKIMRMPMHELEAYTYEKRRSIMERLVAASILGKKRRNSSKKTGYDSQRIN